MKINLGYFIGAIVVGHWFGALMLWKRDSEVMLWSSGWSLGGSSPMEQWCVLIWDEVRWFVGSFRFG